MIKNFFLAVQPFPNLGIVNPLSMSANDISEPSRRSQRPLSFSGDPSDFLQEESNLVNVDRNQGFCNDCC